MKMNVKQLIEKLQKVPNPEKVQVIYDNGEWGPEDEFEVGYMVVDKYDNFRDNNGRQLEVGEKVVFISSVGFNDEEL